MNEPMFDEIALASREVLASEIISRTKSPALVIFGEDDSGHFRCFQSFGPNEQVNVAKLLRELAKRFEDAELVYPDNGQG